MRTNHRSPTTAIRWAHQEPQGNRQTYSYNRSAAEPQGPMLQMADSNVGCAQEHLSGLSDVLIADSKGLAIRNTPHFTFFLFFFLALSIHDPCFAELPRRFQRKISACHHHIASSRAHGLGQRFVRTGSTNEISCCQLQFQRRPPSIRHSDLSASWGPLL